MKARRKVRRKEEEEDGGWNNGTQEKETSCQSKSDVPWQPSKDEVVAQTLEPKDNNDLKYGEETFEVLEVVTNGSFEKALQEDVFPKSIINADGKGAFNASHLDKEFTVGGGFLHKSGDSDVGPAIGLVDCWVMVDCGDVGLAKGLVDCEDSDPILFHPLGPLA